MTHELKCWPVYYRDLVSGAKRFDVRREGPGSLLFQPGDRIVMREWDPSFHTFESQELELVDGAERLVTYMSSGPRGFTGRSSQWVCTYVLRGPRPECGLPEGVVVLGVQPASWEDA